MQFTLTYKMEKTPSPVSLLNVLYHANLVQFTFVPEWRKLLIYTKVAEAQSVEIIGIKVL